MRAGVELLLGLALLCGQGASASESKATRHGIALDLKSYPQATAQETLASVLKAIEAGRFDYLTAQLADPDFVDQRVRERFGGQHNRQVEDVQARLDPGTVKLLQRFLKDGAWSNGQDRASVRLKDVKDRVVFLRRIGDRWFLEHPSKPEEGK
jgi:hypothetical protein